MRRKKAKAPKRRLVYPGPRGVCPRCGKDTEVTAASFMGELGHAEWTVPDDVLSYLYREVAKRIQEKDGKLYVTDPSEYDATRRSKFFFVDGGDAIAGPFGQRGLKVFLGSQLAQVIRDNPLIYIVATTPRALRVIRESPHACEHADEVEVDESIELF